MPIVSEIPLDQKARADQGYSMSRAEKSLNYWRSELWESQYYCHTRWTAHAKRWFKRCASRARRRVSRLRVAEQ